MSLSIALPQRKASATRSSLRRAAASRRACVAVLSGLTVLLVLQLAAALLLEHVLPGLVDPDYRGRLARVEKGRAADPGRTETVVMLGSSRTYYGLHAEALNAPLSRELGRPVSVVNFGYTGAGPLMELLTWRRLQHDGVRPDLLLIEVHPAFLSSAFPPVYLTSEALMPTPRLRWTDLAVLERYAASTRPTLRQDLALAELNSLYMRRIVLIHALAPALQPPTREMQALVERLSPDPFPTEMTREGRESRLDQARREYTPYLGEEQFHLGGRGCEALQELLRSCRAADVPAALVLAPEGPACRSWYSPATWARIQNWLEQFSREEDVPLINAREWIDEDDFVDSHHLLPRGADKFTDRLGREYVLPLLRQRIEPRP